MIVSILFGLECYHFATHVMILCGWRMLPRKDLVKQRIYFLIDLICAASSYLIHRQFLWLIILQNIQHIFYFMTWEKSWLAKRVVSWSSLDWDRSRWAQIDLVLGTLFDVAIHALNSVLLFPFVDSMEGFIFAIVMNIILAYVFIFNPKFAWSNPEEVPKWVQSRIKPLSADQRQEIKTLEKLGQMF